MCTWIQNKPTQKLDDYASQSLALSQISFTYCIMCCFCLTPHTAIHRLVCLLPLASSQSQIYLFCRAIFVSTFIYIFPLCLLLEWNPFDSGCCSIHSSDIVDMDVIAQWWWRWETRRTFKLDGCIDTYLYCAPFHPICCRNKWIWIETGNAVSHMIMEWPLLHSQNDRQKSKQCPIWKFSVKQSFDTIIFLPKVKWQKKTYLHT